SSLILKRFLSMVTSKGCAAVLVALALAVLLRYWISSRRCLSCKTRVHANLNNQRTMARSASFATLNLSCNVNSCVFIFGKVLVTSITVHMVNAVYISLTARSQQSIRYLLTARRQARTGRTGDCH